MSSGADSLAFEPSPAVPDFKIQHASISAMNHFRNSDLGTVNDRRSSKEVRFSPAPSFQPRAHSVPVVAREGISSASVVPTLPQLPRNNHHSPAFDVNALFEQCKAALDRQRQSFEKEREAFASERKLWEVERSRLLGQVADLQLQNNKKAGGQRRHSNEPPASTLSTFRSEFSISTNFNDSSISHDGQDKDFHPVWETPDLGPAVTRVFSNEKHTSKKPEPTLPSISEDNFSPLDGSASPNTRSTKPQHSTSVSIPIEKIDSELDGITIKSTALPKSIVAKVISPDTSSPQTPSPRTKTPVDPKLREGLLLPDPQHLRTNAGHTPLAFDGSLEPSKDASSASTPSHAGRHLVVDAQSVPIRPPHERADSYFVGIDPPKDEVQDQFGAEERPGTVAPEIAAGLDDDPELKGQLTLDSEPAEGKQNHFLDELDKRLEKAKQEEEPPSTSSTESRPRASTGATQGEDEDIPLKLRASNRNFGSAFGSVDAGHMR